MSAAVTSLLCALETELKQLKLWSSAPADPVAMASSMPFCYDTMPLEHWLQYVFLPRMHELMATASPLPSGISVFPLAEMVFQPKGKQFQQLLKIIAQLDNTLTGQE